MVKQAYFYCSNLFDPFYFLVSSGTDLALLLSAIHSWTLLDKWSC